MLYQILKRILDYILALLGLFFSFPLWIILAFAIWLEDRGVIFYKQERVGKSNIPFQSIKFRSMVVNAEKGTGPIQATKDDPRITRVGRFLRHTALDELPQLINIASGEMSFVGPRPLRQVEIESHGTDCKTRVKPALFSRRTTVLPGLTGVAQVYAARDIPRSEKLKFDLWYIRNRSICLDLKLILQSVWISLCRKWDRVAGPFQRRAA